MPENHGSEIFLRHGVCILITETKTTSKHDRFT